MMVQPQVTTGVFEHRNLDWISTTVDAIVVLNKWYTPLVPTKNVRAFYLIVEQTNNGATDENLEVELTVDGVVHLGTIPGATNGTPFYKYIDYSGGFWASATVRQILALDLDQSAPLETRRLEIRVRQTSAVDLTAAQIEVNMVYDVKVRTST